MKEAGEIIDLLDKGTLKDLRFATFTFENNPTGKMLLGISFVLSKQYSEHLSESVSRGNRRLTEDGAFIGKMKHGYYINDRRELCHDGDNFLIIKEAFRRRLDGESQLSITEWLNTTPYQVRRKGGDPKRYRWDKDALSKVLRDPAYAGVLKYGENLVVLADKYDFTPAITVEEFLKINKVESLESSKILSVAKSKRQNTKADLLRGIVWCGYCNKPFSSGLTNKRLKSGLVHYYNYKCETEGCSFRGKSVRANVILTLAKEFFETHLFVTEDNYAQYVADAKRDIAACTKELISSMARLSRLVGDASKAYQNEKEFIKANPALAKHYDLDARKAVLDDLEAQLIQLKLEREQMKNTIVPFKEYLELFKNIGVILREMHNMQQMDFVIKKFFSNFTVKDPRTQ